MKSTKERRRRRFFSRWRNINRIERTTILLDAAITAAVTYCLLFTLPSKIVVNSFSFIPLFHRRRQCTNTISIYSSPLEEDRGNDNDNGAIKKAVNLPPSLVDWKFESGGKKITGRSLNHPVIPDGELLTTACLDLNNLDDNGDSNNIIQAGDVVSTIKGTKYKLLKSSLIGSSDIPEFVSNTNRVFSEDVFTYSTGLPYGEQLAFLEELTDMVKSLQAAEAVTTSSPTSTIKQSNSQQANDVLSSVVTSIPKQQQQQPRSVHVDTVQLQGMEELQQPMILPTNQPKQHQQLELQSQSKEESIFADTNGVLGGAVTIAAATVAAAVSLGGTQSGIGIDIIDEANRQMEVSPAKEFLASVSTQVQRQSKVVLPYLEDQIRIAEAKFDELKIEEKAKNSWDEVAEALNTPYPTTAATTKTKTIAVTSLLEPKKIGVYISPVASLQVELDGSTPSPTPTTTSLSTSLFEPNEGGVELLSSSLSWSSPSSILETNHQDSKLEEIAKTARNEAAESLDKPFPTTDTTIRTATSTATPLSENIELASSSSSSFVANTAKKELTEASPESVEAISTTKVFFSGTSVNENDIVEEQSMGSLSAGDAVVDKAETVVKIREESAPTVITESIEAISTIGEDIPGTIVNENNIAEQPMGSLSVGDAVNDEAAIAVKRSVEIVPTVIPDSIPKVIPESIETISTSSKDILDTLVNENNIAEQSTGSLSVGDADVAEAAIAVQRSEEIVPTVIPESILKVIPESIETKSTSGKDILDTLVNENNIAEQSTGSLSVGDTDVAEAAIAVKVSEEMAPAIIPESIEAISTTSEDILETMVNEINVAEQSIGSLSVGDSVVDEAAGMVQIEGDKVSSAVTVSEAASITKADRIIEEASAIEDIVGTEKVMEQAPAMIVDSKKVETEPIRAHAADAARIVSEQIPTTVVESEKVESEPLQTQTAAEEQELTDVAQFVSEQIPTTIVKSEKVESDSLQTQSIAEEQELTDVARIASKQIPTTIVKSEKVELESLQTQATAEEQVLTDAARIVSEQLDTARREIEKVATNNNNNNVEAIAKVATVEENKSTVKKFSPSLIENFGGNFVVVEEFQAGDRKPLRLALDNDFLNKDHDAITSDDSVIDKAVRFDTASSKSTVRQKSTLKMVEDAITVDVERVVDSSVAGEEQVSNKEESILTEATEMPEIIVVASEVTENRHVVDTATKKVPDMIETGKKAAQSIADTGREVLDNGKQTFHTIQTNGQAIIDTGKRKAKTVVDTGREAIDTGKRTAKEIKDTAHKVGVKGKEVYETSQEYIEKGHKVVNVVKEKVPEMFETGLAILEDERKVKTIAAGVTIGATIVAASTIAASTVAFQAEQKEEHMNEIDKGNINGRLETNGLTTVNDATGISGTTEGFRSLRTSEGNDTQPSAGQKIATKTEKLVLDSRTSASKQSSSPVHPSSAVSAKFTKDVLSISNGDNTLSESSTVSRTFDTKEKSILASKLKKTASATQEMAKSESIPSVVPTKKVISPSFGVRNNAFVVSTTKPMPKQAIKNGNHIIPLQGKNKTMTTPKLVPSQIGSNGKASSLQPINNKTVLTPPAFGVRNNPYVASTSKPLPKEATKNENHVILLQGENKTSTTQKLVPSQIRSNGKVSFLQSINNKTASTPPRFGVRNNPYVASTPKAIQKEAIKNVNHTLQGKNKTLTASKPFPGQIGSIGKAPSFLQPVNNRTVHGTENLISAPQIVPGKQNYALLSNEINEDSYAPPMTASDDPPKPIVNAIQAVPVSEANRTMSLINDVKKFPVPYVNMAPEKTINTFGIRDKKAYTSSNSTKTMVSTPFGVASSYNAKGQGKKMLPLFPQEIHKNNSENTKSRSSGEKNPVVGFAHNEKKFPLPPQGASGPTSKKIDSSKSSSNRTRTSSGPRSNFGVPTKTTKTSTDLLPVQNKKSHFPPIGSLNSKPPKFSVPSTQMPSFGVPNSPLQPQETPYVSNETKKKTDETNCSDFTDSSSHDVPTVVMSSSSSYNTGSLPEESSEENVEKTTDASSTQVVNEDFEKRMSTLDESVLNGNNRMYGKSPDELMAEVMRIAREQEEIEAR